jgi:molecular chaperone GrpE (heat shock protein)
MMKDELDPIRESLSKRISRLDEKHDKQMERNQSDGSTAAVWREVDPKIRMGVVEDCLSDLVEVEKLEEILRVFADWRRREDKEWEFKTTNTRTENNRNDIKKAELRTWADELVEVIPEDEFRTCGICGSMKMPESDRRRKTGYKWQCPDCGI